MLKITETEFVILDTETTGADTSKDVPIEVALVRVCGDKIEKPVSWLINPKRKIPPDASAVHHLTDEDVKNAPTLEEVYPEIIKYIDKSIILAHNADFDMAILSEIKNHPYFCTLKFAKLLWQRSDTNNDGFPLTSYQQQVLRYWLGLTVDTMGLAPHRAAADILVTAKLFQAQVKYFLECGGDDDIEALTEFLSRPIEIIKMPSGKFFGQAISDIDIKYLEYRYNNEIKDPDLKASIKKELDRRKAMDIVTSRNF